MKKILLLFALISLLCVSACEKQEEPVVSASPTIQPTSAAAPSPTPQGKMISASEKSKIGENWSTVGEYGYDIDNDNIEENIKLSTSAQMSNGAILWDDGQQWTLEVSDGIETFTLFDEYVQNGNVYMDISDYYENNNAIPTITVIKSAGADFEVISYKYNSADNTFTENVIIDSDKVSDGGINQRYSSIPYIE